MKKQFKKSFLDELNQANQDLQVLNDEIKSLIKRRDDLQNRIKNIKNILIISNTPIEGDTVSYKLGNSLLNIKKISDLLSFPSKVISIYKYSKEIKLNKNIVENKSKELVSFNIKPTPTSLEALNKNILLKISDKYDKGVFGLIYQDFNLIEDFKNQIKNSKAYYFFIDSHWKSDVSSWDYSLLSKSFSSYQSQSLLEALNMLRDKGVNLFYFYKYDSKYFDFFKHIINYVDKFIVNDFSVYQSIKENYDGKVFFFPGAVNVKNFNPSNQVQFNEKNENIIYFLDYKIPFYETVSTKNKELLESISKYVIKAGMKSTLEDNDVKELSYYSSQDDYSEKFKKYKFSLCLANEDGNIIPQMILDSLSCGVPVISTRSKYLENIFSGVVQFVESRHDVEKVLSRFNDKWKYFRLSHLGYRSVIKNYHPRVLKSFIDTIDNGQINSYKEPLISIVMATMREKYIDRVLLNLERQNYSNKEIIFVTQNFSKNSVEKLKLGLSKLSGFVKTKVIEDNSDITLGKRLNLAASYASGEYIAKMDDDDFYFENYLTDMMLPFIYGNYDVVGKAENFVYLEGLDQTVLLREGRAANREMEFVAGPTLIIKKSVFNKLNGFLDLNRGEDSTLIKRVIESGGKVYSADSFNFIQFRSSDVANHTWQQKEDAFAKSGTFIANGIAEDIVRL